MVPCLAAFRLPHHTKTNACRCLTHLVARLTRAGVRPPRCGNMSTALMLQQVWQCHNADGDAYIPVIHFSHIQCSFVCLLALSLANLCSGGFRLNCVHTRMDPFDSNPPIPFEWMSLLVNSFSQHMLPATLSPVPIHVDSSVVNLVSGHECPSSIPGAGDEVREEDRGSLAALQPHEEGWSQVGWYSRAQVHTARGVMAGHFRYLVSAWAGGRPSARLPTCSLAVHRAGEAGFPRPPHTPCALCATSHTCMKCCCFGCTSIRGGHAPSWV